MKTVIVDDEPDAIYTLECIIKEYLPELEIVGKFTNPVAALLDISGLKPDLLFLDINMPEMDGFDFLLNLNYKNFHIVFTTAYDTYAVKAYKFEAVDYLLKPISIDELKSTIERLKLKDNSILAKPEDLKKLLEELQVDKNDKLSIATSDGIYFIKPSEIVYFLASGTYSKLITKNNEVIFVSKTLKELEGILSRDFFRVHNSYIINLQNLKMIQKKDGWNLLMENGDKIPIARRKRIEISNFISKNDIPYLD